MCIIAAKPEGIKLPSEEIMQNMWQRNDDGAGIMYAKDGKVYIEKGFMKYEHFIKRVRELDAKLNLQKLPVVMHFRITTHGGTKPENCHPFPLTDSIGMMKKLKCTAKIGVAHNGIIPITPKKGISDTMEYIASQLAPLSKAIPKFYKNKYAMEMIANATDGSRITFLTGSGEIYNVGQFVEHEGIMYSNHSFERTQAWRDFSWNSYSQDAWELYEGMIDYRYAHLMWLDESKGDFVLDGDNNMLQGDFAIDVNGNVYEYDYEYDAMEECPSLMAYTGEGMPKRFVEDDPYTFCEIIAEKI